MPRPPVVATVDWKAVFAGAKTYRDWLTAAEFPEHAAKMEDTRSSLVLPEAMKGRLGAIGRDVPVLAFAEDWCGDVVRHVPALELLASQSPRVVTRYVSRADHPEVFIRFLTNGGEAVPKFVFFGKDYVECGNWGPMEMEARALISRGKACGNVGDARKKVSALYGADPKQERVFDELISLLEVASCDAP